MSELESLRHVGNLVGHSGCVTSLATGHEDHSNLLISTSKDRLLIIWNVDLSQEEGYIQSVTAHPHQSLRGHSHYISEIALSSDNNYAITGSWDTTMRLWDLNTGQTIRRFIEHSKEILTVAISSDNRQLLSGSRDNTIKLWNTLGEAKHTIDSHYDWVTSVRFAPINKEPLMVSASWDNTIKLWDKSYDFKHDFIGHTGGINSIAISPDGNLCASGAKDNTVMIWHLFDKILLRQLDAGSSINALAFSPTRYWLAAANDHGIKICNLESMTLINDFVPEKFASDGITRIKSPGALSVAWSWNGDVLCGGFTDGIIRAYAISQE